MARTRGPETTTVIELVIYAFHIARLGTASRGA